ncbi:MAG: SDR family oxidoreductase [Pedobacter sp.]|nr:MAG: SDR family oxidoreductase [Pedobacter sp.]
MARRLDQDYCLILHASREEHVTELREGNYVLAADLSDPDALKDFCKRLKAEHGDDLYAVINNAGVAIDKPLIYQPERDIDHMMQVNLKAPIIITKAVIKLFGAKGKGVIINVSSCVATTGNAYQSVYAATKAGLISFSRSMAKEVSLIYEGSQIRVLSIAPGFIETAMTAAIPDKEKVKYLEMIPSGRFGKPEDIAETVAFLLSERSAYINGSSIDINGGLF